jgi:hypothetical protein
VAHCGDIRDERGGAHCGDRSGMIAVGLTVETDQG